MLAAEGAEASTIGSVLNCVPEKRRPSAAKGVAPCKWMLPVNCVPMTSAGNRSLIKRAVC